MTQLVLDVCLLVCSLGIVTTDGKVFQSVQHRQLGDTEVMVTWNLLPGQALTWDYKVSYTYRLAQVGDCQPVLRSRQVSRQVGPGVRSLRLSGLTSWRTYRYKLKASSTFFRQEDIVTGLFSTRPSEVSHTVQDVALHNITSTMADISWREPPCADRNGALRRFDVQLVGPYMPVFLNAYTALYVTISNLQPSTRYSVRVRYVNTVGPSAFTEPVYFTTAGIAQGDMQRSALVQQSAGRSEPTAVSQDVQSSILRRPPKFPQTRPRPSPRGRLPEFRQGQGQSSLGDSSPFSPVYQQSSSGESSPYGPVYQQSSSGESSPLRPVHQQSSSGESSPFSPVYQQFSSGKSSPFGPVYQQSSSGESSPESGPARPLSPPAQRPQHPQRGQADGHPPTLKPHGHYSQQSAVGGAVLSSRDLQLGQPPSGAAIAASPSTSVPGSPPRASRSTCGIAANPCAPYDLRQWGKDLRCVNISWKASDGNNVISAFDVFDCTDSTDVNVLKHLVTSPPGEAREVSLCGLRPGRFYMFGIRSRSTSNAYSGLSTVRVHTHHLAPPRPQPPELIGRSLTTVEVGIRGVQSVNGPVTSYYVIVSQVRLTEREKVDAGIASSPAGYWKDKPVMSMNVKQIPGRYPSKAAMVFQSPEDRSLQNVRNNPEKTYLSAGNQRDGLPSLPAAEAQQTGDSSRGGNFVRGRVDPASQSLLENRVKNSAGADRQGSFSGRSGNVEHPGIHEQSGERRRIDAVNTQFNPEQAGNKSPNTAPALPKTLDTNIPGKTDNEAGDITKPVLRQYVGGVGMAQTDPGAEGNSSQNVVMPTSGIILPVATLTSSPTAFPAGRGREGGGGDRAAGPFLIIRRRVQRPPLRLQRDWTRSGDTRPALSKARQTVRTPPAERADTSSSGGRVGTEQGQSRKTGTGQSINAFSELEESGQDNGVVSPILTVKKMRPSSPEGRGPQAVLRTRAQKSRNTEDTRGAVGQPVPVHTQTPLTISRKEVMLSPSPEGRGPQAVLRTRVQMSSNTKGARGAVGQPVPVHTQTPLTVSRKEVMLFPTEQNPVKPSSAERAAPEPGELRTGLLRNEVTSEQTHSENDESDETKWKTFSPKSKSFSVTGSSSDVPTQTQPHLPRAKSEQTEDQVLQEELPLKVSSSLSAAAVSVTGSSADSGPPLQVGTGVEATASSHTQRQVRGHRGEKTPGTLSSNVTSQIVNMTEVSSQNISIAMTQIHMDNRPSNSSTDDKLNSTRSRPAGEVPTGAEGVVKPVAHVSHTEGTENTPGHQMVDTIPSRIPISESDIPPVMTADIINLSNINLTPNTTHSTAPTLFADKIQTAESSAVDTERMETVDTPHAVSRHTHSVISTTPNATATRGDLRTPAYISSTTRTTAETLFPLKKSPNSIPSPNNITVKKPKTSLKVHTNNITVIKASGDLPSLFSSEPRTKPKAGNSAMPQERQLVPAYSPQSPQTAPLALPQYQPSGDVIRGSASLALPQYQPSGDVIRGSASLALPQYQPSGDVMRGSASLALPQYQPSGDVIRGSAQPTARYLPNDDVKWESAQPTPPPQYQANDDVIRGSEQPTALPRSQPSDGWSGPRRVRGRRELPSSLPPGQIMAELQAVDLSGRFFWVGDNKTYGGFTNSPLRPDGRYRIYLVANSEVESVAFSTSDPLEVSMPQEPTEVRGSVWQRRDNFIIMGVMLAVAFFILIIMVWLKCLLYSGDQSFSCRCCRFKIPEKFFLSGGAVQLSPWPAAARSVMSMRSAGDQQCVTDERHWSETYSLSEPRSIVTGRQLLLPTQAMIPAPNPDRPVGSEHVTFRKEFQCLPRPCPSNPCNAGRSHPDLNNSPTILPFDATRVVLEHDGTGGGDYVNASHITGYMEDNGERSSYISGQCPFDDSTALDTWRLIWQHAVTTVVVMTRVVEEGTLRCLQFWPDIGTVKRGPFTDGVSAYWQTIRTTPDQSGPSQKGDSRSTPQSPRMVPMRRRGPEIKLVDQFTYAHYTELLVSVRRRKRKNQELMVRLFCFTSWPEKGVPRDAIPFVELCTRVHKSHGTSSSPILVLCETGSGRSAVFIAVDILLAQYATENQASVYDVVCALRSERPHMVQTFPQYAFIYEAVLEEMHAGDTWVSSTDLRERYKELAHHNPLTGRTYFRDQFMLLDVMLNKPAGDVQTEGSPPWSGIPQRLNSGVQPDVIPAKRLAFSIPSMPTSNNNNNKTTGDNTNCSSNVDHWPAGSDDEELADEDSTDTGLEDVVYVHGYRRKNQFMLTPIPQPAKAGDFWQQVYNKDVRTIVIMDDPESAFSGGQPQGRYWPGIGSRLWEPYLVELLETSSEEGISVRTFRLAHTHRPREEPKMLKQFQFHGWSPEPGPGLARRHSSVGRPLSRHSIVLNDPAYRGYRASQSCPPLSAKTSLLALYNMVKQWQEQVSVDSTPVLVQCGDGVLCSGLYVALSLLAARVDEENLVSVYRVCRSLRKLCPGAIPNFDQYKFLHKALWDYINLPPADEPSREQAWAPLDSPDFEYRTLPRRGQQESEGAPEDSLIAVYRSDSFYGTPVTADGFAAETHENDYYTSGETVELTEPEEEQTGDSNSLTKVTDYLPRHPHPPPSGRTTPLPTQSTPLSEDAYRLTPHSLYPHLSDRPPRQERVGGVAPPKYTPRKTPTLSPGPQRSGYGSLGKREFPREGFQDRSDSQLAHTFPAPTPRGRPHSLSPVHRGIDRPRQRRDGPRMTEPSRRSSTSSLAQSTARSWESGLDPGKFRSQTVVRETTEMMDEGGVFYRQELTDTLQELSTSTRSESED